MQRHGWHAFLLAGAVAAAGTARGQEVRFNAAAQGWFGYCYANVCYGPVAGIFDLDAQIGYRFSPEFEAGGRLGLAFFLIQQYGFGVPIDLYARLTLGHRLKLYLEGAAGPWIIASPDSGLLVGHGEFGIGVTSGRVSFGGQVGWLFDTYLAGVRFGVVL